MNEDKPAVKSDVREAFQELREDLSQAVQQIKEHVDKRWRDTETRLLLAFGDYQSAKTVRFHHLKAEVGNLNVATDQRLAELERRMSEMDKRLIAKNI